MRDFTPRRQRTPEEISATQLANAKRRAEVEQRVAETQLETQQVFRDIVMPGMAVLEPIVGGNATADVSQLRCVASCRCLTKRGRLDVQIMLQPHPDGTITMTAEAMEDDDNQLSKRVGLHLSRKPEIVRWLKDQIGTCALIRAEMER